jgi:hypothetical protein
MPWRAGLRFGVAAWVSAAAYGAGVTYDVWLPRGAIPFWAIGTLWAFLQVAPKPPHRAPWIFMGAVISVAGWLTLRNLTLEPGDATAHQLAVLFCALSLGCMGAALSLSARAQQPGARIILLLVGCVAWGLVATAPRRGLTHEAWDTCMSVDPSFTQVCQAELAQRRVAGDAAAAEALLALLWARGADAATLRALCPTRSSPSKTTLWPTERSYARDLCQALHTPLAEAGARMTAHQAALAHGPWRPLWHRLTADLYAEAGDTKRAQGHAEQGGPLALQAHAWRQYTLGLGPRPTTPWRLPIAAGVGPNDSGVALADAPGTLEILPPHGLRPVSWLMTSRYLHETRTHMPVPRNLPVGARLCLSGSAPDGLAIVFTGSLGEYAWSCTADGSMGLRATWCTRRWSTGCIDVPTLIGTVQAVTLRGPWLLSSWQWLAPEGL